MWLFTGPSENTSFCGFIEEHIGWIKWLLCIKVCSPCSMGGTFAPGISCVTIPIKPKHVFEYAQLKTGFYTTPKQSLSHLSFPSMIHVWMCLLLWMPCTREEEMNTRKEIHTKPYVHTVGREMGAEVYENSLQDHAVLHRSTSAFKAP